MKLGYTLHSIISGKKALPVGSVESFTDADYDDMLRFGAVRAPTADELKLYEMAHPSARVADDADADQDSGKQSKAAKKAAAKAAKEAADNQPSPEPSTDPDVREESLI